MKTNVFYPLPCMIAAPNPPPIPNEIATVPPDLVKAHCTPSKDSASHRLEYLILLLTTVHLG